MNITANGNSLALHCTHCHCLGVQYSESPVLRLRRSCQVRFSADPNISTLYSLSEPRHSQLGCDGRVLSPCIILSSDSLKYKQQPRLASLISVLSDKKHGI